MNSSATVTGCDDIIKRLREAIAAGPTPGPWKIRAERYRFIHVYATGGGICHLDTVDGEGAANAKLITAASPDNITALLDRLDAADAENERLRAAVEALAAIVQRDRADLYGQGWSDLQEYDAALAPAAEAMGRRAA